MFQHISWAELHARQWESPAQAASATDQPARVVQLTQSFNAISAWVVALVLEFAEDAGMCASAIELVLQVCGNGVGKCVCTSTRIHPPARAYTHRASHTYSLPVNTHISTTRARRPRKRFSTSQTCTGSLPWCRRCAPTLSGACTAPGRESAHRYRSWGLYTVLGSTGAYLCLIWILNYIGFNLGQICALVWTLGYIVFHLGYI